LSACSPLSVIRIDAKLCSLFTSRVQFGSECIFCLPGIMVVFRDFSHHYLATSLVAAAFFG
jgi:hypothetical protein